MNTPRARLIPALLQIVELEQYREDTPQVETAANLAKAQSQYLNRLLRLQVKSGQTNIQICNKLLRKLGYKPSISQRLGRRGEQVIIWAIANKEDGYRGMD